MQQEDPHVRTKEFRVPTPKTIQYIPCTYGNVYAAYVRENLNEGEVLPRYLSEFFEIARSDSQIQRLWLYLLGIIH